MRRADAVEEKVVSPSKGLVTRIPSDQPSHQQSIRGGVTTAQNMRYDFGVMRNGPGFLEIEQLEPLTDKDDLTMIFQEPTVSELGIRNNPIIGTERKLFWLRRLGLIDDKDMKLVEIYPGADVVLAGTGDTGYDGDGSLAVQAELSSPSHIATDSDGNVYVADTGNHAIRKISLTGIITTIAGTGVSGFSGDTGLATVAQLSSPSGIAVDRLGNIYISDRDNHRIRKITALTGIIDTIAGDGTAGSTGDGGAATSARVNAPRGLFVNQNYDLWIADTDNHKIRKITNSTGFISTVAGTGVQGFSGDGGVATSAQLSNPYDIVLDIVGNLWIADTDNNRIRKVNVTTSVITTVAGTGVSGNLGEDGEATSAQLSGPEAVTLDSSTNLYIADRGNNLVKKVLVDGTIRYLTEITEVAGIEWFSESKIYAVALDLNQVFQLAIFADTTVQRRWSATAFYNNILATAIDNAPLYWNSSLLLAREIPGLPVRTSYDGITAFANHVILWKNDIIKWSDLNDFSMWIPVSQTAASLVLTIANPFTQPAVGEESDFLYVNEDITGLVEGQFLRIIQNTVFNYFEVAEVAPIGNVEGRIIDDDQTVSIADETNLYTQEYRDWLTGSHIGFESNPKPLEVVGKSINENYVVSTDASFVVPAVDAQVGPINLTAGSVVGFTIGQFVSVNSTQALVGSDVYEVVAKDIGTSPPSVTLKRVGVGSQQNPTGGTYGAGSYLISQPYVRVKAVNTADLPITIDQEGNLIDMFGFRVKSLELTGRSPTGTEFVEGTTILSVDANSAGELQNSGSGVNGPIWQVITLGDRACVFKERSIQSMQAVGSDAGTFIFITEISDEGLYGRYTIKKVGEDVAVFLGHKDLYVYGGGKDLRAVAQLFVPDLLADIDQSRADEIIFGHDERSYEIRITYFDNSGVQKQFIYNYKEDSCTYDVYPTSFGNITAIGAVDWRKDIAWEDAEDAWEDTPNSWDFYQGEGEKKRAMLIATDGREADDPRYPLVLDQGNVFNHDGAAYLSSCETVDFDFQSPEFWKYIDTVRFSLQVKQQLDPRPFKLFMQVGCRDSLDADIRWSEAQYIEVSGNGNVWPKINLRKSGRYGRLKFYSEQADIQWRISSYNIIARVGGSF